MNNELILIVVKPNKIAYFQNNFIQLKKENQQIIIEKTEETLQIMKKDQKK